MKKAEKYSLKNTKFSLSERFRKIHTWYERRHGIHQKCYGHKIKKKVTTLTSQPSSSLKYIKNKKEDRLILFQNKQDKYQ